MTYRDPLPGELHSWKAGDPYCGTALEAINFVLETMVDTDDFLRAWREGDLAEWPDFKFAPEPITPSTGPSGDEAVEELKRRWKQYRDNSVDAEFSVLERMAFGGRAGGILEAIELLRHLSAPGSDRGEKTHNE